MDNNETKIKTKAVRSLIGAVISINANKMIVIRVDTMKMHPKYHKQYRVSRKYHVHDEKNLAKVGDTVKVVACRPMSATKRWRLDSVVKSIK